MAFPSLPTFGELLRHYRLTCGMTEEQLAKGASITVEALNLLEQGTPLPPRKETVERLADILDLEGSERSIFLAAGRLPSLNLFLRPNEKRRAAEEKPAPAEPAPIIQVFLIADVRGYTRFTQEQGDEAAARLASRFATLVREAVTLRG